MSDKENGSHQRWRVFSRLRALRDRPLAAEVLGCSVALLVLIGFFTATKTQREKVSASRGFIGIVRNDENFYMTNMLLGRDYPLLAHIRKAFPPGTMVAVTPCDRFRYPNVLRGRRQRFWLALLPEYPIGPSKLVICPQDQVRPTDKLIRRGYWFVLVRREPDEGTGK